MKKKLTNLYLEKLRINKEREDIWDTLVPSLLLIVRKSGKKHGRFATGSQVNDLPKKLAFFQMSLLLRQETQLDRFWQQ